MKEFFKSSHGYFDKIISTLKPRVIMVDYRAEEVFQSVYPITDHQVTIEGEIYPAYLMKERKQFKKQIQELLSLPYRGKEFVRSISIEDMEQLINEGLAE